MLIIQRATTTHDTNGNPRRIYIIYNPNGTIHSTHDEGYQGLHAVPNQIRYGTYTLLEDIQITPKEYKRLKNTPHGKDHP